jgi:hypothetical protein
MLIIIVVVVIVYRSRRSKQAALAAAEVTDSSAVPEVHNPICMYFEFAFSQPYTLFQMLE